VRGKSIKKAIRKLMSMVFLLCAIISGAIIVFYLSSLNASEEETEHLRVLLESYQEEQVVDDPLAGVKALHAENPDCIGWLKVEGTTIDEPVMYTPDEPEKYLRKNWYLRYSISGMFFIDARCSISEDGNSTNTIIYGHRMNDDSKFGALKYFKDSDYVTLHSDISFDTIHRTGHYKVFAVIQAEAYYYRTSKFRYYDVIDIDSERKMKKFLSNIKEQSIYYDESVDITQEDELLTLSTCDYFIKNGRLAVIAVRIDD